jgi:hypothetical protein
MMKFAAVPNMILRVPRGYRSGPNQGESKQNLMSSRDEHKLSPRAAQLADNLDRFLNKHKRCHKHIIESEA